MAHVLVLISDPARPALDDSIIAAAREALRAAGATPQPHVWLAPGVAADLPFAGSASARAAAIAAVKAPVDIAVVAASGRRKRLLVADMESTLVENEFL